MSKYIFIGYGIYNNEIYNNEIKSFDIHYIVINLYIYIYFTHILQKQWT
jgi:hypothetical protein